jgi:SRSO17 transposase
LHRRIELREKVNENNPAYGADNLDKTLVECNLSELNPIRIEIASDTHLELLWDTAVNRYHYLGHKRFIGRRLKYLAYAGDRPVAAIGFRSASLKLEARDCYIGWSEDQKKKYLKNITNNNRFLVFDWVRVPHLASHVLSKALKALSGDWKEKYGDRIYLVETFVDPERYRGVCYKASNFKHIGVTKGYTKDGVGYKYHGVIKEVYVYELETGFRKIIGCEKKPYPRRPEKSERAKDKEKEIIMMIQKTDYNPELIKWADIDKDAINNLADELVSFHNDFNDCFNRVEQHVLGWAYLKGLLSDIERKNIEAMALRYLGADPNEVRSLQKLMTYYRWYDDVMLGRIQEQAAKLLFDEEGMITVDSSEFPKKGKESVGVYRQYCGNLGKVENCQSGVFLGYTSSSRCFMSGGYMLLDKQLYMPEDWFSPEYAERRKNCRVPDDLTFKTKIEIAFDLISKAHAGLFPSKWLGADATFGSDSKFRDQADSLGMNYFVSIKSDTLVWIKKPEVGIPAYAGKGRPPKQVERALEKPVNVYKIADGSTTGGELNWETVKLAEGAKGPIIARIARLRVIEHRDNLPGKELWLFIRKDLDGNTRYAFSNAPVECSMEDMKRVSTMRWPIEQCFEDGKKYLGMDHYELRSWIGWHRHMTYVFLALLFLLKIRTKCLQKKFLR